MADSNATFKKINDLYKKKSFLDKYGSDIWLTVIISLVFFCITTYYYVLNNLEPIRADWDNQKCSPTVLPFAGLINKGPNETALDFTSKNFTGCIQSILVNIVGDVFQPVYYVMKNVTDSFNESLDSVNSIRGMFDRTRGTVSDFSSEVMGRTLNITMPIVQMLIGIKSMGAKMTGVLTGSLFTLFGSYLTLKSFFLFLIELITVIVIILAALIVTFLIISFIPIFGSWAIPIAATNIAIMILILVPALLIQIFMKNVMSLSSRSLPTVPRCFAGATVMEVKLDIMDTNAIGTDILIQKNISDVEIGDVLKNGERVTAVMKFSASNQSLYKLNGVTVTGEHRVLHSRLGWIKVKYHPDSVLLENFQEPYVYCLGTDTKTFMIGEQVYSDWDDIDDDAIKNLQKKCSVFCKNKELPIHENIHKYLDNGVIGASLVKLESGENIPIKYIQINDILLNGEQVLGIIKIDATDLKALYDYSINGKVLRGSNISICIRSMGPFNPSTVGIISNHSENYLYQLLTDTGKFNVNDIVIRDYNYGIDKYL